MIHPMTAHTPEPWLLSEDREIIFPPGAQRALAYIYDTGVADPQKAKAGQAANAEHIVACVNALAGINPAGVAGMKEALEAVHEMCESGLPDLKQQCKVWAQIVAALDAAKTKGNETQ